MTRREWIGGGLVLGALLAAAFWALFILPGDGGAASPAPITPFTPTETSSPSPDPTTPSPTATDTPVASDTPTERFTPTELPTGEDFQQVLQTIWDIRHQAFERRDERIIGQIFDRQCECSTQTRTAISTLIEDDLFLTGAAPTIEDVQVDERSDDDAVVLRHRLVFPSQGTENAAGMAVDEFPPRDVLVQTGLLRGFGPHDDGRWLVVSTRPITEDA